MIERIVEAARLAPSACNSQPWRFAVVTGISLRRRLADKGMLPGLGMKWLADVPVFLVLGTEKSLVTHKLAPRISGVDYATMDLGIAGEHAVLQAVELGLGTCWIGWIRSGEIRRIVGWPRTVVPQAVIAVGWPADSCREPAPKNRLSADDITKWL